MFSVAATYSGYLVSAFCLYLLYYIVSTLINGPREVEEREIHVKDVHKLADENWKKTTKADPNKIHINNITPLWRNPSSPFNKEYLPAFKNERTNNFYMEYVRESHHFLRSECHLHRGVIIQLLEKLDSEDPVASVVSKEMKEGGDITDNLYGESDYTVLAHVTLLNHALNLGMWVVENLVRFNREYLIPNALIASLAHDIGKLPSLHNGKYHSYDHPEISCRFLKTIEGFDQMMSAGIILKAILNHHYIGKENDPYLVTLIRLADKEARIVEYYETKKLLKDKAPVKDPSWTMETYSETLKQLGMYKPIRDPNKGPVNVARDVATTETTTKPEVPTGTGGRTKKGQEDPRWHDAVQWVQTAGLDAYTVDALREHLKIGIGRGDLIFAALLEAGHLYMPEETIQEDSPSEANEETSVEPMCLPESILPETSHEETQKPTEETREQFPPPGPNEELINLFDAPVKDNILELLKDDEEETEENMVTKLEVAPHSYGTRSVYDELESQNSLDAGEDTNLTDWFDADHFIKCLRKKINVDQVKVRGRGSSKDKIYFQAVSSADGHVYVRIPCVKEIIAEQMIMFGKDERAAMAMERGVDEEDKILQNIHLLAVISYFRRNGIVDERFLGDGYYSAKFIIHKLGVKSTESLVPFMLKSFQDVDEILTRKKNNPHCARIEKITPAIIENSHIKEVSNA